MIQGRKKPYTQRGISRVPCARCGKPSRYQWSSCALNNLWFGLCHGCDVALNQLVVNFMGIPVLEGLAIMEAYAKKVGHTLPADTVRVGLPPVVGRLVNTNEELGK